MEDQYASQKIGNVKCRLGHGARRLFRAGGNVARFINHACKPNCYSQIVGKTIWIRAGKNIKAGDELTYDYHTDGERIIQCNCVPGCQRKL